MQCTEIWLVLCAQATVVYWQGQEGVRASAAVKNSTILPFLHLNSQNI